MSVFEMCFFWDIKLKPLESLLPTNDPSEMPMTNPLRFKQKFDLNLILKKLQTLRSCKHF